MTVTIRPDRVERLSWAYPTDNMTLPPQNWSKKSKKIVNEVSTLTTTKIFTIQSWVQREFPYDDMTFQD